MIESSSDRTTRATHHSEAIAMNPTTAERSADSRRGADMAPTVGQSSPPSDNGHLAGVDLALAREHGGKPATWHSRRFGHYAVNTLTAAIIRAWRASGDVEGLAAWVAPLEAAMGPLASSDGAAELRAALADAEEDSAEATYRAAPTEANARALLRKRAADRAASLSHDAEIARRHGLTL